ncbi:TauD/TfdA family dioxygenase [Kitasatospora sp. NPDC002227]|uniref:TauD/TfdA family dioxygenase n=1 Tax=Kitasatospora sp. NPDC002227 TaxID=3154773 RepID=UPI0033178B00
MNAPVVVQGPSVWRGSTLRERDWLVPAGRGRDGAGGETVARAARALREGPRVAVVRGLDLEGLTDEECAGVCRRFMAQLGDVRPEDPRRPADNLVTAQDRTRMPPHTDRGMLPRPSALLGLLCVRPAGSGGESVLASGHTVHNTLLRTRPAELSALYLPYRFGDGPAFRRDYPVFERHSGRLDVHYNRYWITRGQRECGAPLTVGQEAALDAFDAVLADPRTALRVRLGRGDLLLVDNRTVLHGRAAFTDPPAPRGGRCLVRVWAD